MKRVKISFILQKALDILTPETWCKGTVLMRVGNTYKRCVMGAIFSVDRKHHQRHVDKAQEILSKAVRQLHPYNSVVGFNDASQTKFKDVQRVFKKAIKLAQKDERLQSTSK